MWSSLTLSRMPTAGIERRRQIDLIRRHLDDVHPPDARRLQRQDRGADIAAHLDVVAGHAHQMRDQRRRGRFAVGAGDGDERRIRAHDAGARGRTVRYRRSPRRRPVAPPARSSAALGWVSGAPGVSTSAAKFAHDTLRRSAVMKPACAASASLSALSSPAITSAPPAFRRGSSRARSRRGRTPRPSCRRRR